MAPGAQTKPTKNHQVQEGGGTEVEQGEGWRAINESLEDLGRGAMSDSEIQEDLGYGAEADSGTMEQRQIVGQWSRRPPGQIQRSIGPWQSREPWQKQRSPQWNR